MKRAFLGVLLASMLWWEGCVVPAWVTTAEQDAQIAIPIAASLVDVVDPALAPVVTLVENGFSALVKTLDTYKAQPTATNLQAVQAAFTAVNANVQQLESAAQIKTTASQATVTGVVQLLTQAVTEIAALVPENTGYGIPGTGSGKNHAGLQIPNSPASSANSAPRVAKGWKAKDFKKQFNSLIRGDPRFAGKELK